MQLIDTHAHLDDKRLAEQLPDVLERASKVGIEKIIGVGTTAEDSSRYVELAQKYPPVYAAVGIQPNYCHQAEPQDWEQIIELSRQEKVVAIGETGLDRYWDDCPFDLQLDYFERHIKLSQSTQLPFIIHMRECEADVIEVLQRTAQDGKHQAVMHSYTGTISGAETCLELGLYISFAGMVTYKKSAELREVAASIPDERILVETDSPYLSPEPKRGHRPNEPALVVHTAECIADCRNQTLEELAALSTANAKRLFRGL